LSLLGTGRRTPPAFPLHLLGPWAGWCERKAKEASAPVDYVAMALLASVGATIANVRWPQAGPAWSEPPVLWCAEVGPPSSSKSPSMEAVFNLVQFAEADLHRAWLGGDDRNTEASHNAPSQGSRPTSNPNICLRAVSRGHEIEPG
jgi:hypothetical protein